MPDLTEPDSEFEALHQANKAAAPEEWERLVSIAADLNIDEDDLVFLLKLQHRLAGIRDGDL